MRPIVIVFIVFAIGIFLGHEFWPQSHADPAWHFRFHRGKIPHDSPEQTTTNNPAPVHSRILRPAEPTPAPQTN